MKLEKFTHIGEKSPKTPPIMCEDRLFSGKNMIAVIDGATSTTGIKINGLTDGAYIAEYFVRRLNDFTDNESTAKDILSQINREFGQHLKNDHPTVHALGKNGPTASAVLVKFTNDNFYTFAQVGDCMLIEENDGQYSELTKDNRHDDDQMYIQKAWKMAKEQNKSILEIRQSQEIIQDIINHRLQSNVTTGCFNGDPCMDTFITHGKRPIEKSLNLTLMSDGMAHPEFPVNQSYIQASKLMLINDIDDYYKTMKKIYDTDIDFKNLKYSRFKHIDDASAIIARL
ncbi:MAG: serine/threonine protein phosphatase PrpC [Alphaproteobacteria bacterium]|jgi:serine/threonine protein phosphatase PrpC